MAWIRRCSIAASLCFVTLASGAQGAHKLVVPLTLEDAFSSNGFLMGAPFAFSPDGTQIAYVLCDAKRRAAVPQEKVSSYVATYGGAAMYSLGCDVWVSPSKGGPARNISGAEGNNWGAAWSPDGQQIAFYSDRGDSPRLWIWEAKSGTSRAVTDEKIRTFSGTQLPVWLPDGKHVIARMRPEGKTSEELGEELPKGAGSSSEVKPAKQGSTVKVYEAGRPETAGPKTINEAEQPPKYLMADIGIVDVTNGQVRRIVKEMYASAYWLSPDGTRLLYPIWKAPRIGSAMISPFDYAVVDLQTGQSRIVMTDVFQNDSMAVSWSPDGKSIAYLGSVPGAAPESSLETGFEPDVWGDLYVVSADGGKPKKFTPSEATRGFDAESSAQPWWSEDSSTLFVVGENRLWRGSVTDGRIVAVTKADSQLNIGDIVGKVDNIRVWAPPGAEAAVFVRNRKTKRHGIYVFKRDGQFKPILLEDKKYASREESPMASLDGKYVAYGAQSAARLQDLWTVTAPFATPVRVTNANPQLDKYALGSSRLIEYLSSDGKPLQAAVLLPAGYQSGKRYPTIVLVYASGMGSQNANYFGLLNAGQYNMHLLATRGYVVLNPDIPVEVGTPMRDMMKGVMPAIDKAVELGITDADRLGLTGQSNGGYSTLSLITQTHRFKAAVMNAGFGDLIGFYGAMDPDGSGVWHPWLERLGGAMGVPPWENPQRYVENSPIFYLDRITTPLLIQAGGEDSAIVQFSDQAYVGLKRLNKNVIYLRYESEGHILERQANQLDYSSRVFAFWDQYLKGGTQAAARNP